LRVAPHLVRFEYDDPHWDVERGQVAAREVVTLFGLTLASERRVDYGRVEPKEARRMFIAEALAADQAGFGADEPAFLAHNRAVRRSVREAEARLRKRDLNVGEAGVAGFYDDRLPPTVRDRTSLLRWCAAGHGGELHMTLGDVATRDPGDLVALGYASELTVAGQRLPLSYSFEPGQDADGITLTVPRSLLGAIRSMELEWLVPAWLPDKVVALLRALPKDQRRPLVPLPQTATTALAAMAERVGRQPLAIALAEALRAVRSVEVPPTSFDERALPVHFNMNVAVVSADGQVLAAGRDLKALQRELGATQTGVEISAAAPVRFKRSNLQRWDVGDLPDSVVVPQRPRDLVLYPCLVDHTGRVDLVLEPPGPAAEAMHRAGVRRLLLKALPQQAAMIRDRTLADRELVLHYHGVGDSAALVDDVLCASADQAFELDPPVRTAAEFAARLERGRAQLVAEADGLRALLAEILPLQRSLRRALGAKANNDIHAGLRDELKTQLAELVGPRMLTETPREWRAQLPRYLRAAEQRWHKRVQRDEAKLAAEVGTAAGRLAQWQASHPGGAPWPRGIIEYRWLVEELRVSLFAQQLGTVRSVSSPRLEQAWRRALADS
jgi:ATP-dependent helicase HrpA